MRFLADMGIGLGLTQWLRSQGHDVVHLRDEGLYRLPDIEVFAKAGHEGRILLTFDLDFGEIAVTRHSAVPGVIVFRLRDPRTPSVIRRLTEVIRELGEMLAEGSFVVVEDTRVRVRRLPGETPEN